MGSPSWWEVNNPRGGWIGAVICDGLDTSTGRGESESGLMNECRDRGEQDLHGSGGVVFIGGSFELSCVQYL